MATLADLVVSLKLDSGHFAAGLQEAERRTGGFAETVNRSLRTVGFAALGLGGVLTAGVGAAAAVITQQFVPAASDLNEALNASGVIFGDAAGRVQEFGQTAADTAGLSAAQFNQMAAEIGAMLRNFGFSTDTAAQQTIDLTQRAADMASIFNTDVSDALFAIQAGIRGETEPLRRFGVGLTDAAIRAKAMDMGLGNVTRQTDQAAYAQATLALIMEQTDTIAGDFVNTSDELANQTRVNQARWANFKAELGTAVLPVMTTLQRVGMRIAERVMPVLAGVMDVAAGIAGRVADAFDVFVRTLDAGASPLQAFSAALHALVPQDVWASIMNIVNGIQAFIQRVWEVLRPVVDFITRNVQLKDVLIAVGIAILSVVIPAIVSAVAAAAPVIAVFLALIAVVALLRNVWENDIGGIRTALTEFWTNTAQPALQQLVQWLQVNIPAAVQAVSEFWTGTLLPAFQTVIAWLQTNVPPVIQGISNVWNGTLLPALWAVWGFLSGSVFPLFQAIGNFLGAVFGLALRAFAGIWQNVLMPALRAVWDFLQNSIFPIFQNIGTLIAAVVGPKIAQFRANTLDPLRDSFSRVRDIIQSVIDFISNLTERIGSIELPDWMTPGSPSPWEIALRGVADAMVDLSEVRLPRLEASMSMMGSPIGGGGKREDHYNLTINTNAPVEPLVADFNMLRLRAGA